MVDEAVDELLADMFKDHIVAGQKRDVGYSGVFDGIKGASVGSMVGSV